MGLIEKLFNKKDNDNIKENSSKDNRFDTDNEDEKLNDEKIEEDINSETDENKDSIEENTNEPSNEADKVKDIKENLEKEKARLKIYEDKAYDILSKSTKYSVMDDDGTIYFPGVDLRVELHVIKAEKNMTQIIFVLRHKDFAEDIIDSCAGIGVDLDGAVKEACTKFCFTTLSGISNALKDENGIVFGNTYDDKINKFKMYKSLKVVTGKMGGGESKLDYAKLLQSEILKRIGNKKVYYVKVYACKSGNRTSCDCRVNGVASRYMTKIIEKEAKKWEIETPLYMEEQYFCFIQDESTYQPYKYTKRQIIDYTMDAVSLFKKCDSNEKYKNLYNDILSMCKDSTIACNLFNFIPEITCMHIFRDVSYSEEADFYQGEKKKTFCLNSIMDYNWIYSIMEDLIQHRYFSNEEIRNVIGGSAYYRSIIKAMHDGTNLKDLASVIAFNVPDDYEFR